MTRIILTPEERRVRERERARRWRLANPDKRKAQQKRDRDKHLEARRAAQRQRSARAKDAGYQPPRPVRINPNPGPAIRDCAKSHKPELVFSFETSDQAIARGVPYEVLPSFTRPELSVIPARVGYRGRGAQG